MLNCGGQYACGISKSSQAYQASGYTYTDPYGRVYTIGPDGALQSLKDLNGNTLTVTANGITSSNGLSVPFVRDGQGRITKITAQITGTVQADYLYHYNAGGELDSVTLPSISPAIAYTYDPGHFLHGGRGARGNTIAATTYDS